MYLNIIINNLINIIINNTNKIFKTEKQFLFMKRGRHFRTESVVTYLFMFVLIGAGISLLYLYLSYTPFTT